MNDHGIKIPDSIDFRNPSTITKDAIISYYSSVRDKFGEFCGDCEHMTERGCLKKHKPRKYDMEIGPYDYAWLRKNCADFELYSGSEVDEELIKKRVSLSLNCNAQTYG